MFSIRRSIKARELRLVTKENRKMAAFLNAGLKKRAKIDSSETALPNWANRGKQIFLSISRLWS